MTPNMTAAFTQSYTRLEYAKPAEKQFNKIGVSEQINFYLLTYL